MAKTAAAPGGDAYERKKQAAAERSRTIATAGRGIGPIPPVADPARRLAGSDCFRTFCETYFDSTFALAWSDDHLKVIRQIERVVRKGGQVAIAMPRGSGKSSLAEAAAIWALVNGYRCFVVLIGASKPHAEEMLESIKREFESKESLADDYPEVCVPIRKLEGIANRCRGQLYNGNRTLVEWTADSVVLPTVRPEGWEDFVNTDGTSLGSGGIIKVAGIEGRLRGLKHKTEDGRTLRPDLVIPDDPQTDESARSPSQNHFRERTLAKAVLGMGGPRTKVAAIMPLTVIEPGDMADNILDRQKHPQWNGIRTKLLYAFPAEMALWEKYRDIRADSFRAGNEGREATEFYRERRAEMDRGAVAAWAERYSPGQLSAVQFAMDWWLDDAAAMLAEGNNDPVRPSATGPADLTAGQIAGKLSKLARGVVPLGCDHVTAFVDVQGSLLYWMVCAWGADFSGAVVDYGAFPDQGRAHFTLRDAKQTLALAFPNHGPEAAILAGLHAVADLLCGRAWRREDGAEMRVTKLIPDANYVSDTVFQFARTSKYAAAVMPSHGRFVGASHRQLNAMKLRDGDKPGLNWRIPAAGKRVVRYVLYDVNFWKTFVYQRLGTAIGDRGALSLFGTDDREHRLLSEHLTAEKRVSVKSKERECDEWQLPPSKPDNHWFDCLVGNAVAASILGASLIGEAAPAEKQKRRKLTIEEMKRQRGGKR